MAAIPLARTNLLRSLLASGWQPQLKGQGIPQPSRPQPPASPVQLPAGVYKTLPYTCIVVVPGPASEPGGDRDGPLSLSLSPSEGERVPKAGEGAVQGRKARIPSGNSHPDDRMIVSPPDIHDPMPIIRPDLQFIPLHPLEK